MKLNDLRVRTRLGGGFAAMLVLLAIMMAVGIFRVQAIAASTRVMMETTLIKERLTDEQYRNVVNGVTRGKALAKTSDAELEAAFAQEAKVSTERGNDITKALAEFPTVPAEQKLLADLAVTRKAYLGARDSMMRAKKEGKTDEVARIYSAEFIPSTVPYLAVVKGYLDFQRAAIDDQARSVALQSSSSVVILGSIGAASLLAAIWLAWALTGSITRPVAHAASVADAVARGDLSNRVVVDGKDELSSLLGSLKLMNSNLSDVVGNVRQSAESVANASFEISQGNNDLSSRTEQQASSLQQTAAAMESLGLAVKHNAHSAKEASQLAIGASAIATRGGDDVQHVVATMKGINDSSKKISDIIGVIDGIAFQTNILALNAAVEAARAGEQGRGFAVVASEVRSLAARSADAAKEIKVLIGTSVERVEQGTALVDRAGSTMAEVVASIQRLSDLVAQISSASAEQSTGVLQVGQAVTQMDQATQQNAALVEESAAAAESLKSRAADLVGAVAVFQLDK